MPTAAAAYTDNHTGVPAHECNVMRAGATLARTMKLLAISCGGAVVQMNPAAPPAAALLASAGARRGGVRGEVEGHTDGRRPWA